MGVAECRVDRSRARSRATDIDYVIPTGVPVPGTSVYNRAIYVVTCIDCAQSLSERERTRGPAAAFAGGISYCYETKGRLYFQVNSEAGNPRQQDEHSRCFDNCGIPSNC